MILADWAAVAIDNARLYETSERRREELERAVRGLEATRDMAVAIGGEIALEHVLELIVKRGRALVGARSLVIMLREGDELVVQASAGHVEEMRGARLPIAESTSGQVLEQRSARSGSPTSLRGCGSRPSEFGVRDAQTALLVPMVYRGEARRCAGGVRPRRGRQRVQRGRRADAAHLRRERRDRCGAGPERAGRSAAQLAGGRRRRAPPLGARAARRDAAGSRRAAGAAVLGAAARGAPASAQTAMREAVEQIEREIANLRSIITELRPAALDELGLRTAIEALLDRHREQQRVRGRRRARAARPDRTQPRLDEDLETTVYRLVQEALTNVAKHAAREQRARAVSEADGELLVEVQDDGVGFDPGAVSARLRPGRHARASVPGRRHVACRYRRARNPGQRPTARCATV